MTETEKYISELCNLLLKPLGKRLVELSRADSLRSLYKSKGRNRAFTVGEKGLVIPCAVREVKSANLRIVQLRLPGEHLRIEKSV